MNNVTKKTNGALATVNFEADAGQGFKHDARRSCVTVLKSTWPTIS